MAGNEYVFDRARRPRPLEPHLGVVLGVSAAALEEHASPPADLARKMTTERRLALLAQAGCALFRDAAAELRHPRRGRARAGAEPENMQEVEAAIVDQR